MTKNKEGIENFILKKLERAHTLGEIRAMLEEAGFSKAEIDSNFDNIKKTHRTLHQDIVASNKFLPPLRKGGAEKKESLFKKTVNRKSEVTGASKSATKNMKLESEVLSSFAHIGLFAGRLRRKDFIVSILFLFSLFFSIVIVVSSFVDALFPDSWIIIKDAFMNDPNGIIFLYTPIILAPFTLIFLSLVTRRLHDLDLPGIISFLYLAVFIYPFSEYVSKGMIIFDVTLFILFVCLLTEKGENESNRYGRSPAPHGSTFKKILNLK